MVLIDETEDAIGPIGSLELKIGYLDLKVRLLVTDKIAIGALNLKLPLMIKAWLLLIKLKLKPLM